MVNQSLQKYELEHNLPLVENKQIYHRSVEPCILSAKYLKISAKNHSAAKPKNRIKPISKKEFDDVISKYQKIEPISKAEFMEMMDRQRQMRTVN